MNSNRKTSIIVGALFLTAIVAWLVGYSLIETIISAPDYLINVSANETRVIIGALIELINSVAVVGIAVMLFPVLKQHNERTALGYVGFRIIEATILVVGLIFPLSLITLSREYVKAGASAASYFQTLGDLLLAARYWSGQMVPIFVGLGGLLLCYSLYQSKLIPRFISVWGLIGYALLITVPLLDIFGYSSGVILGLPGGLFEIFLAIWLIVKGFNSSVIVSESAKTDAHEMVAAPIHSAPGK